jgi:hypothetical protein
MGNQNQLHAANRSDARDPRPLRAQPVTGEKTSILQVAPLGMSNTASGNGIITAATAITYNSGAVIAATPAVLMPITGVVLEGGQGGYITKVNMWTSYVTSAIEARLHFFSKSTRSGGDPADNSAWNWSYVTDAALSGYRGYIDLPATEVIAAATTAYAQNADCRLQFTTDSAETSLYMVLETRTTFNRTGALAFVFTFGIERG